MSHASRSNTQHYSGLDGDQYLSQRVTSTSDYNQTLRARLFDSFTTSHDTVLDFGCGTGGVLYRLPAARKLGIEIGESAAAIAAEKGLAVFHSLKEVADESVDVVISCHAIEHVDQPLIVLTDIARVLKPGGKARLVIPADISFDKAQRKWRANKEQHLYAWTPLSFGNLAEVAGLSVVSSSLSVGPTNSRFVRIINRLPILGPIGAWHHARVFNYFNIILDAQKASLR